VGDVVVGGYAVDKSSSHYELGGHQAGQGPDRAQIAAQQAAMETIEAPGAAQPGLAQVRSRALQPPGRPAAGGRLGHSP